MASGAVVSIVAMTVFLAIAVVLLAAGLLYVLISRRPEQAEQPDLTPAIQEAAQEATSRALTDLLKVGEVERKRDTEAAEEALDKRQAEIKSLTERIVPVNFLAISTTTLLLKKP